MLSPSLHKQLFGDEEPHSLSKNEEAEVKKHLSQHGLLGKTTTHQPDIDFKLPDMYGMA